MQILFVHPNYPAQFGPILKYLSQKKGVECVFATKGREGHHDGVRCIPLELKGGATKANHYCTRTFENAVWHAHAVYEACKSDQRLKPDLIVGHSGFGTTAFLAELYDCPIVNYFEYYYHTKNSDMDFRSDFPPTEIDYLRARARNAMILIDLQTCTAGYSPTKWQQSLLPDVWLSKVKVIHDGIDTAFWRRRDVSRTIAGEKIADGVRIVTYVSRGLEAMRGFDIFIRVANRIALNMDNVIFVVVGSDRICYGNDKRHIQEESFRAYVLKNERPELDRFRFLGNVPPDELANIFSISDLHIYLTVPFVLSWSMLNALSCECIVLASATAPVTEFIEHDKSGLLAEFSDVDELVSTAIRVLNNPQEYRHLGYAGRALIKRRYSIDKTFPKLWKLYTSLLE